MKLDLEAYEEFPSTELVNFNDRIKRLIPSLYEHRCSPGVKGGFFIRLDRGTWLGHIIEHIALEIQCLAGMDCGFGRTFGAHEYGVYHVLFTYQIEEAGLLAAQLAFQIANCLAQDQDYTELEENIQQLRTLYHQHKLGPSTESIVQEAKKRGIPVSQYKGCSYAVLGHGCYQKKIWATVTSNTSSIGVDIVADKALTKQILHEHFIPVAQGKTIQTVLDLENAISDLGFPLVIKPVNGNHGRGIMTNIQSRDKALLAFELAKNVSYDLLVERFLQGYDYRFLVINYQVVAVAKRTPAQVIGDGHSTIEQLINEINLDPRRGLAHENILTTIKIDEETISILEDLNLNLKSVLDNHYILTLKGSANLSAGGTATDVTDKVHPTNIAMAERIARLVQLDVCGIDIMAQSIEEPVTSRTGGVLEVNAGPGFRMHLQPNQGKPRNVAAALLDTLFPKNAPTTIPVVAVTGTNGKTTVVRLVAALARQANHRVGFTTTEGIYLDDQLVYRGDCSGPQSARTVLADPGVDFAVLECARGGIIRSGLGFDTCDISIITNIGADHLGLNDIHTIEELTQVKSVVAKSTHKNGYAILNADDDNVYSIKEELSCQVALFGLNYSTRIEAHCSQGGLAVYTENNQIVVQQGIHREILINIQSIPLTFNGGAVFMLKNVLPVVLVGKINQWTNQHIADTLSNFFPSVKNTPGRMNLFDFDTFKVLVDYAHNEEAYLELSHFFNTLPAKKRVGIIAATGDRRDSDIKGLGYQAGQIFDEIIIHHIQDSRGRENQQMTELLMEGINRAERCNQVNVISDSYAALRFTMDKATPDTVIFYSADDVFASTAFMTSEVERFASQRVCLYEA